MAHYDIYRQQLALNFHAFGHALWEPSPGGSYGQVEIGDVGFITYGKFHRIFNVLLPENDPTHANFATPEDHEPLKPRMQRHVDTGELSPNDFHSGEVKVLSGGLNVFSSRPEGSAQVSFTCSRKQGAILSLPVPARREDTLAQGQFREWMIKHVDRWFDFFKSLKLGIECMEDIVLITGLHRTLSCTNVVFFESSDGAQVSFGVRVASGDSGTDIRWQFSREQLRGVLLNRGPSGDDLHENQCIFVRGLRATRFLGIFPTRLQAAAGPSQLEDPNAHDPRSDKQLISIPSSSSYQEPLHILLKYIAEKEPNCDMALVHDDDLACLHDSSLESLDHSTFMDYLRSSQPRTYCREYLACLH
ncbi:hypothetical protein BC827DRAFT_581599 [Russula dissimulans]|nr:hypothetical protein BC827DRAFT_581599 [Russula dissimulans]